MNVLWHMNLIGQGIWVFISAYNRKEIRSTIPESYWVIIGIICVNGVLLIVIFVLMAFHCYLSCYSKSSTFNYVFHRDSPPKKNIKLQKRDAGPES